MNFTQMCIRDSGMVSVARKLQPKLIIGLDLRQKRMDMALKCGADIVMNPMETDVAAEIHKLTDGYGCDVYIEASGSEKSVQQGMASIRFCGRYVPVSYTHLDVYKRQILYNHFKENL